MIVNRTIKLNVKLKRFARFQNKKMKRIGITRVTDSNQFNFVVNIFRINNEGCD